MAVPKTHETGESVEADFDSNIWQFRMEGNYRVSAGRFAIEPIEIFEARLSRLDWAERMMRHFTEAQNRETMGERDYEALLSFFDPKLL